MNYPLRIIIIAAIIGCSLICIGGIIVFFNGPPLGLFAAFLGLMINYGVACEAQKFDKMKKDGGINENN